MNTSLMRRAVAPSLIAVGVALAIGGGTAVAAHHYVITSTKQIKPGVLKKLHGNGSPGATGATGAPGKDGAVAAYSVNGTVVTGTNGSSQSIVSKALPAGAYVVSADVLVSSTKGATQEGAAVSCTLHVGAVSQTRTFSGVYNPRDDNIVSGTIAFDAATSGSTATTATVQCTDYSGANGAMGGDQGTLTLTGALTALQVATVS